MKLDKVINKTHTVLYRGTNMAYMKKVTKTADGRIIVLEKYYSWKVRPTSCVLKEKRAARRKESPYTARNMEALPRMLSALPRTSRSRRRRTAEPES